MRSISIMSMSNTRLYRVFEWLGAGSGIAGAALLALNMPYSGFGFVAFLLSNGFWMAYGCLRQAHGLISMQIVFTITSVIGIYRWFFISG